MSTNTMRFPVEAWKLNAHGDVARCKDAAVVLAPDLADSLDRFNPPELLAKPWFSPYPGI
jgi:hypothetical protein